MGNGNIAGERKDQGQKLSRSKNQQLGELIIRRKSADNLIFYACTDKARVITEILEERGWSRTKDHDGTNFTIKWCLEHQVDWKQFREGKQLINNIPGQIAFVDKVNLWYTIRDYLNKRRNIVGNEIQTFLPMTFILDDENEVAEFLRVYKRQNRTWIYKPRYNYAGQGIHVISVNSDLEPIFKIKPNAGNRIQYQPKSPGYLMQEYVARPLLIKGRKFDIRVHWLVAWTKPLLVFYNHNASVIRLSLNLYREFDFDRATHLTNLSVQENHYRYASSQEATGMTMQQLNQYFNQCFRPFHPKMCQDWVLTVMQDRMQTIIRQVVRASKEKLERTAGHFGLFGCDFLIDENFRLWLLEVNDNPGVGWGNTQVNTTTKPLFEETLDIVFECFEKYKRGRPVLPIECLNNYQLIYNENNDTENLLRDDTQVFSERASTRYLIRDLPSRSSLLSRSLPRLNISRTSTTTPDTNTSTDVILPVVLETNLNKNIEIIEPKETFKPIPHETEKEYLMRIKTIKAKYTFKFPARPLEQFTRPLDQFNTVSIKRSLTSVNGFTSIQRKKRIELKPMIFRNKRNKHPKKLLRTCTDIEKKENSMIIEEDEQEKENQPIIPAMATDEDGQEQEKENQSIIPEMAIEQNVVSDSATVIAV